MSIMTGFGEADEGVRLHPRLLAQTLAAMPDQRQAQIAVLGSETGRIGSWLAARDPRFNVTGVDRDLRLGLPFDSLSVDAVVAHRARDRFVGPAQRAALTAEIARVVRPGGWVSLLEDMFVFPTDPEGAWYTERYAIHRRVLALLLAQDQPGMDAYAAWLDDPDAALLMSLRALDGTKLDDTAWLGRETELAEQMVDGRVRLRGIGIHETVRRVQAEFKLHGLQVRRRWRVAIPEQAPRQGHATILKGLLFRRVDPPAG